MRLTAKRSQAQKHNVGTPCIHLQIDLFTPAFRKGVKEKESFFLLEEAFLNDSKRLSLYAGHILDGMR